MNQSDKKKAILLIVITVVTVVLGVIAVITAMRLRKLATVPVTPNNPESQPAAAEIPGYSCSEQFGFQPSVCNEWCDEDSDCAGNEGYDMECVIGNDNTGVCRNTECTEEPSCTCPAISPTPTPTPIPPSACNEACTEDGDCAGDMTCYEGLCRNPSCEESATCACPTPTPSPTPTNTPVPSSKPTNTPTPKPTNQPTNTPVPTTPPGQPTNTPAPTSTPIPVLSCNDSCTVDADCSGTMVCSDGLCRNPSCTDEPDCVCPVAAAPTQVPQQELPTAGSVTPTLVLFSAGLIILLIGAFGWIAL